MAKFPALLFVKTEKADDADYFVADVDPATLIEMGVKVKVATYQRVDIQTVEGVAKFTKIPRRKRGPH